jgi:hypothetical protein
MFLNFFCGKKIEKMSWDVQLPAAVEVLFIRMDKKEKKGETGLVFPRVLLAWAVHSWKGPRIDEYNIPSLWRRGMETLNF